MRRLFTIVAVIILCTLPGAVQAIQLPAAGIGPAVSSHGLHLVADADPVDSMATKTELAVWNTIKASGNLSLLKAFVKTYPNSIFTPITEAMIAELDPTAPVEQSSDAPVPAESSTAEATESSTETAALPPEPAGESAPYDGAWRLTGFAHSFKRYSVGICQNPDRLNDSFSIRDGEIDAVLTSRTGNTARVTGSVTANGLLQLNFQSGSSGLLMLGRYSTDLEPKASSIRFTQKLETGNQAGCRYDFVLKRVR